MKRKLDRGVIDELLKSKLWLERLKSDCEKGEVFLAIRDNRVDFYHKGGKLFSFDDKGFRTHIKYAAVIDESGAGDYLTENELAGKKLITDFSSEYGYKRIKENCGNYAGVEASGVSDIYKNHSYLTGKGIMVLDIEISFDRDEVDTTRKKQDRIDMLIYDKTRGVLRFVETKHFSNGEIWSTKRPKVVGQIGRYEDQVLKNKSCIIAEYSRYIDIVKAIFNLHIPHPKSVEEKVGLLIFGFDDNQKTGRLAELITHNKEYANVECYAKGSVKKIALKQLF